jgi:hypothetical protein
MEEPEEADEEEEELPPFDWERLFRWLLVVGLVLWVVAGAIETFVLASVGVGGGLFATGSETSGRVAARIVKISAVVESIAFRTWIASGAFLIFLWYRTKTRDEAP